MIMTIPSLDFHGFLQYISTVDNAPHISNFSQDSDDYDTTDKVEVDQVLPADPQCHDDFDDMVSRFNAIFDPDEDKDRHIEAIIRHLSYP